MRDTEIGPDRCPHCDAPLRESRNKHVRVCAEIELGLLALSLPEAVAEPEGASLPEALAPYEPPASPARWNPWRG